MAKKFSIAAFGKKVKAFRRKHPNVSFKEAQKKVSRSLKPKKATKRKGKPARKKAAKRKVSGVRTISKTHTDKNRFKSVNVQIGSIEHHRKMLRKGYEQKIATLMGQRAAARKATDKKKYSGKIREQEAQLRKLYK